MAIVIVNFEGWPDVGRLVAALAAAPEVAEGRCELVVVDNGSTGPIPEVFLDPMPGVRLVALDSNGGFAAGVNAGWRASAAPWLLLLNPDVVAGPELVGRVLARLDAFEGRAEGPPAVVGFGLRNADGTRQGSVGAPPSLARCLWEPLIPRTRRKYQPAWRTRPGPVPWVTGACALVRAEVLERLGGMDDEFFLYYEEVALCRSARRLGGSVEYDPGVEVVHLRPLQGRRPSPALRIITRHSKLLYFRKHLPRREFLGLSWLVAAEARARGAWAAVLGRADEARAWRAIGALAASMRRGQGPRGREVLEFAESALSPPAAGPGRQPPRRGPRQRRPSPTTNRKG
ncbi:MAG TPA: glycosyltransferase family 2 protein [Isosphaeraceae bacterium]|nr:glycosyltransferase family 2 protein [Isosphaeraceae bacterium]